MRNSSRQITKISVFIVLMSTLSLYNYAQTAADSKENEDIKSKYELTLEFGIESSVLETIESLQEFNFGGLEEKVFFENARYSK